jgi:hypothetical protein
MRSPALGRGPGPPHAPRQGPKPRSIPPPESSRQGRRIVSIGLDPVSRLLGNQRRRHHSAFVTQRYNLPIEVIERITRWFSFASDPYLLILACRLLNHAPYHRRTAIDLAEIPAPHHDPHRQWQLYASTLPINPDENLAHGPPCCVEALLPEKPSCSLWYARAGRLTSVGHCSRLSRPQAARLDRTRSRYAGRSAALRNRRSTMKP